MNSYWFTSFKNHFNSKYVCVPMKDSNSSSPPPKKKYNQLPYSSELFWPKCSQLVELLRTCQDCDITDRCRHWIPAVSTCEHISCHQSLGTWVRQSQMSRTSLVQVEWPVEFKCDFNIIIREVLRATLLFSLVIIEPSGTFELIYQIII